MIFDESYEDFLEITLELFDVPEDTMKWFHVEFSGNDLENVPSICKKVESLLESEDMKMDKTEIDRLNESVSQCPSIRKSFARHCCYLVSNGKMAQIGIGNDGNNSFTILIAIDFLRNSKTWLEKGFTNVD